MTIFEKLITVFVSVVSLNSVTFSNLYFLQQQIPNNQNTNQYLVDAIRNEGNLLDYLFPGSNNSTTLTPPLNLSYTLTEFQKFKGTYLTPTSAVGNSYFNDTILLGDSLTYGLQSGHISSDKVLASIGKFVYNILDTETTLTAGSSKKKVIDWLAEIKPKKIYINLGTNGIESWSNEMHIEYYNKMLDRIVAVCPGSTIILVGISPWSEAIGGTSSSDGLNKKINHFNTLLIETAKSRGMFYLNACETLLNGRGALADVYNAGDGTHWNVAAQTAYMNYLKTHAVK
ncbi:MAG: GDSL-type esterase/lipase family protein [Eubacteriales bacterium]|nr:GDSL-type esterase/lipase family protein [Eubacteriales bacterium]MDD4475681.1 GDSL-type esterase/lipase family protein [Eubacteriales bacterium]